MVPDIVVLPFICLPYVFRTVWYRVTSYTLPCVSGRLQKVACPDGPFYSSGHLKSQSTRTTRPCLFGQVVDQLTDMN